MFQTGNNVTVLPIETTNAINLQDLNDDCLLKTFSSNLLTPLDLCSLAETCVRFKQLAQRVFPRYLQFQGDYNGYKFVSKNDVANYTTQRDAKRIFKIFGSCLSTISMHWDDLTAVSLVAKHCNGGVLSVLKIHQFGINEKRGVKLAPIIRQLLVLHIATSSIGMKLDISGDSLIELKIAKVEGCDEIFNNTFPNLERFTFEDNDYNGSDALTFIGRHKKLKTLDLDSKCIYRMYDFAHTIGNDCKQLEELTLRKFSSLHIALDFSNQTGPTKLKMLDVNLGFKYYSQIYALLQTFKSLEIVKLSSGLFREEARSVLVALSELPNLRELHLINCWYKHTQWKLLSRLKKLCLVDSFLPFPTIDLLKIVRGLANLDELEIRNPYSLSEEELSEICEITERRTNVLTLKYKFDFSEDFLKNCNEKARINLIKLD